MTLQRCGLLFLLLWIALRIYWVAPRLLSSLFRRSPIARVTAVPQLPDVSRPRSSIADSERSRPQTVERYVARHSRSVPRSVSMRESDPLLDGLRTKDLLPFARHYKDPAYWLPLVGVTINCVCNRGSRAHKWRRIIPTKIGEVSMAALDLGTRQLKN